MLLLVLRLIDKGGRCNASQSDDLRRMATLSQTRVNSNYVLNFHNDAYNLEADMHGLSLLCVLVYKIKVYCKKSKIGNAISGVLRRSVDAR